MGENAIRATKIISKIVEANELEEASIYRLIDLVWHGYKFIDIKVRKDSIEHEFQGDWLVRLSKQLTANQQALDTAVEALKFYADENSYKEIATFKDGQPYFKSKEVLLDKGQIARAALASIKE